MSARGRSSYDQGALVKPREAEFLRLARKDSLTMRALLVERNRSLAEGA